MCQVWNPGDQSGFVFDSSTLREFIARVEEIRAGGTFSARTLTTIGPHFAALLANKSWLPEQYQEPFEGSGMGSGIGMWLLYRAADSGLAFSSLVVPAGAQTPVHDHLAWGLVGLYRGSQDEEVFRRHDDAASDDAANLALAEQRSLTAGDFYELTPETDIHRVRTTSNVTSVSLHLLGNDNGCIWRHRYHPEQGRVEPFRSGYVNVPCPEQEALTDLRSERAAGG